jgi:hypothetical protein
MSNRSAVPTRPRNDGLHGGQRTPRGRSWHRYLRPPVGRAAGHDGLDNDGNDDGDHPSDHNDSDDGNRAVALHGEVQGHRRERPGPPGPLPTGQLTPPPLP